MNVDVVHQSGKTRASVLLIIHQLKDLRRRVMEEQVLGKLLDEGVLALEYIRTGEEEEAYVLLEMVEEAKMRGFQIVQEALELTNDEFNALDPEWFNGDGQRGFGVLLHAYKQTALVSLHGFEFIEGEQKRTVKPELFVDGKSRSEFGFATREQLALWLVKAQDEEIRDAIVESIQEREFMPFVYYKVWYGDNWDYDYYNLRNLPVFEYQQFGMTVDEPWRLVWAGKPLRVEQVCVNEVDELPDWCPSMTVEVRGQKMSIKVPPRWAWVRGEKDDTGLLEE